MKIEVRKAKQLLALLLLGGTMLLVSCGGSANESESKTKAHSDNAASELEKKIREVVYPIPTGVEIAKMLQDLGAGFIIGITNDPSLAPRYETDEAKALNLGVYGADISYLSVYNQQSEINIYLKASNTLIEGLGINGAFGEKYLEDIESVANDKEALVDRVSELFTRSHAYLQAKNQQEEALLILAGTWIEGMYITLNISDEVFDDLSIVKLVSVQRKSLATLIEAFKPYKDSLMMKDTYSMMKKIDSTFQQEDENSFSVKQLLSLKDLVNAAREQVVSKR